MIVRDLGHTQVVETFAVGFARPDRRWTGLAGEQNHPWHAVAAHRPTAELDGEVELAVCGAIVQVWGSQQWDRVGVGGTACSECARIAPVERPLTPVAG